MGCSSGFRIGSIDKSVSSLANFLLRTWQGFGGILRTRPVLLSPSYPIQGLLKAETGLLAAWIQEAKWHLGLVVSYLQLYQQPVIKSDWGTYECVTFRDAHQNQSHSRLDRCLRWRFSSYETWRGFGGFLWAETGLLAVRPDGGILRPGTASCGVECASHVFFLLPSFPVSSLSALPRRTVSRSSAHYLVWGSWRHAWTAGYWVQLKSSARYSSERRWDTQALLYHAWSHVSNQLWSRFTTDKDAGSVLGNIRIRNLAKCSLSALPVIVGPTRAAMLFQGMFTPWALHSDWMERSNFLPICLECALLDRPLYLQAEDVVCHDEH